MHAPHTHEDHREDSIQPQPDRSAHPRRTWLAGVAGGGVALLVVAGMMAAGGFYPFARAQGPDVPRSTPPVLESKHTAQEIAAAKRHDLYDTFYHAQLIVVGKVVKQQAMIPSLPGAENRPPTFDWILMPTDTLYVNTRFARRRDDYLINERVPDAELNKTAYLLARTFGEQQTYSGRAIPDLLQVAAVAIEQRKHDDAVRLHRAKTDPSSDPLFKAVQAAKSIAIVDVMDDRLGSLRIDRAGNVTKLNERIDDETHIVLLAANLRGSLPQDASPGSHLRIRRPLPSPVEAQPLLVIWDKNEGRAQATHAVTLDEATLRIAAAALKRDYKRVALEAAGPAHGSSRGSRGLEDPDGGEDVAVDHHATELPGILVR